MRNIKFKKAKEGVELPKAGTPLSSGFDLKSIEDVTIKPFGTAIVKTGLILAEMDYNCEIQIRPRGGVSLNTPIMISNTPGTVDNDYRGEIMIIVRNLSNNLFTIKKDVKIAQMVVCPVYTANLVDLGFTNEIKDTVRGDGALGSTGE